MKLERIAKRFRIDRPDKFQLSKHDPAECCGLTVDKKEAQAMLADGIERLAELQQRLYADDRWSILIVLQAMDAAGKDSIIKHVMSGINPQGCEVHSFKQPSAEELQHDFLWRTTRDLPERGRSGIFNRSYDEEVLIVRVHKDILASEGLPDLPRQADGIWKERYRSIADLERHLYGNGTRIVKFFLHLSRDEQRKRFLDRIDEPEKNWKFSAADLQERGYWDKYMEAYADCLAATSTEASPWYAIPADDKKNARLFVSEAILETLEGLKMSYPAVGEERRRELLELRKQLAKK